MVSPDLLAEPSSIAATPPTELLRRHLAARRAALLDELSALDDLSEPGDPTVAHLGATVAHAQRELAAARAAAERSAAATIREADRAASAVLEESEREARVLRAVTAWLRQVPVGVDGSGPVPVATVERNAS